MKKAFHVIILACFIVNFWSCEENSDTPNETTDPTLSISSVAPEGPYGVNVDVEITLELRTDPKAGIQSFRALKGGAELFSRTNYTSNIVQFNFIYATTTEDLEMGIATFTFQLTDNDGKMATLETSIEIEIEYSFSVENFRPDPSWDMINNVNVNTETGDNVDVQAIIGSSFNGTSITFMGQNGTAFYNVSPNDIDYFDPNISTQQIVEAIQGLTPSDILIISNPAANPPIDNQFPIIAKLRGQEVYAIIGFSNLAGTMWGYRKTSEEAGN